MYDVLIIGGGLVVSSLACALEPLGLRVGMVEATAGAGGREGPPTFDERNLEKAEYDPDFVAFSVEGARAGGARRERARSSSPVGCWPARRKRAR